jgi:NAD(P)-dependent dehydrogenase (short-subunit alcohol dehydrogenase family)
VSHPFPDVSATTVADLLSLDGRHALVTGGAQGLGRAIAQRLAEAGARVTIADLDVDRAAAAAAAVSEQHDAHVVGVEMDVADEESVVAAAERARQELGEIDIWVNNAGIFPSAPALAMPTEQWDRVIDVNTRGVFVGAREAARRMPDGGVIVNIASTAGFRGTAPGLAAYVASKHAVRGLTAQLALELAPRGIRVLGVAPTFVPTEGNLAAAAADLPEGVDVMAVMRPGLIGRLAAPDDIARVVLFCASDMSMVMTGSTLLADAGQTI